MKNSIEQTFTLFSLLKFAIPTIVMMIITSLYTIIDSMFVSHFVGTNALSAINIVFPLINIIMALAIMLSTGGSAVIARKLGKGNKNSARSNLSLLYLTGLCISLFISCISIFYLDPIIWYLGSSELLYSYCYDYLLVQLWFAPFLVLQILCQTFLVVAGNPRLGLIASIAAGIINILLDYLFIVIMNTGIIGAAIATGIGYCIGAACGIIYLFSRKSTLYFMKPQFDLKMLWQSMFNGLSEMITNIAMAVITFLYNIIMMKYLGEDGVAAITIILYMEFLLNALFMGFSMGVAPVISYNYGAKNIEQICHIFKICVSFIALSSIIIFFSATLLAPSIISIFAPSSSNVYAITIQGFSLFSICFLFGGINIFTTALFTAFSNGKISAFISFLRTFIFIAGGLLILPNIFLTSGIWLAMPIAEFLTMLIVFYFLFAYRKHYYYL